MKNQILSIALFMTFGLSLAQEHDHSKMGMDSNMPETTIHKVDVKFQEQLNAVFQSSIKLNSAFMSEDMKEVITSASNVKIQIKKMDMMLLKGQSHKDWMKYLNIMNDGLEQIVSASDISGQRTAFSGYNTGLYQSIKAFGVGDEVFYQFCPMANGNEGAYWLSDKREIRNPYMGKKMPSCGSVKETLD